MKAEGKALGKLRRQSLKLENKKKSCEGEQQTKQQQRKQAPDMVNFQQPSRHHLQPYTQLVKFHLGSTDQDPSQFPQAIWTFLDSAYE